MPDRRLRTDLIVHWDEPILIASTTSTSGYVRSPSLLHAEFGMPLIFAAVKATPEAVFGGFDRFNSFLPKT